MAGVIGGPGGYATVGPTRNYLGEAMSNVQDSMYRQNAQRIADERTRIADEQNLQEQRKRDFNDSMEFSSKYPFIATGTSIDGANRQAIDNAQKSYLEAQDNYRKTGDKKYLAVAENAKSSINNLNEMPKALALKMEDWKKNEAGYSPSSMSKKKAILDKMAKGDLMQENDENGRAVYTLVDRDENGNVSKILYSKLNSKQITDLLTVEPKFDISGEKGLIDQFQKSLGDKTTKVDIVKTKNGEVKRTTVGREGYENLAAVKSKELTTDHSAVYAALEALGLDPENKDYYTDEKTLKDVEASYYDLLVKNAKPTISEEPYLERDKFNADQEQRKITNAQSDRTFNKEKAGSTTVVEEQATHKVTGKHLFDANGNPVMIKRVSVTTPTYSGKAETTAKSKPKYTEGQVKFLMKKNPKATRQQIIDALNKQK